MTEVVHNHIHQPDALTTQSPSTLARNHKIPSMRSRLLIVNQPAIGQLDAFRIGGCDI